jgi:ribosomal protein L37AE/L43A
MGKNVEKIRNMLDGILDPSKRHIRVGWIPGEEEKNAKLEDRENKRNKSDVFSSARMPLFCPKCNKVMKKQLDNKMWMLYNRCFDCQIVFENDLRVNGKFEEWEKEKTIKNAKAYIQEVKNELDDYVDALKADNLLYETGPTSVAKEKWDKTDAKKLRVQWEKEIKEVEDNLETYIFGN